MNHYQARESKGGGWHFTCMNDGRIWPTGYCRDHTTHATQQEAEECYAKYLLDRELRFGATSDTQCKCKECGNWTSGYVDIGMTWRITLCKDHQTIEVVKKHWKAPTEIMSSW